MTTHEFIQKDASLGKLGLFRVYDNNIIVGIGNPSRSLDSKGIDEEVRYYQELIKAERYHSILDVRKILASSKDQRDWIHSDLSKKVIKSYAIVAPNLISYYLVKISIRFKELGMPNKLFRNFNDALEWTKERKRQESEADQKRA